MQTLVYIIGGYCLIKGTILEAAVLMNWGNRDSRPLDFDQRAAVLTATAFLFLAAVEAFNQ